MVTAGEIAEPGALMSPVPPRASWRRPRAWLVVAALAIFCAVAAIALAASVDTISFSSDPVEDQAVTVTVSGSSETARSLFVLRQSSSSACASTAQADWTSYGGPGTFLNSSAGDAVNGSFSKSYSFTPSTAGNYRVCAYVATSSSATPAATQTATVTVRLPNASIDAPAFSADPVEDQPVTTTLTGSSEAARTLFVLRQSSSSACADTAQADWGSYGGPGSFLTSSAGDAVSGSFNQSYSFTPSTAGIYRICAYVAKTASSTPLATKSAVVTVRLPNASITDPTYSADPVEDQSLTTTVAGSSEAARTLFVLRQSSTSACASTAQADWSSYGGPGTFLTSSAGDAVSGSFTKSYSFTPSTAGTYRICAYVAKTSSMTPLASQASTVTVRLPNASISPPTFSADPVEDQPVSTTVAGTSEAARTLWVLRQGSSSACADTAQDDWSSYGGPGTFLTSSAGDAVAGSFINAYSFTPSTAGTYRICAYVGKSSSSAPLATETTTTLTVRAPKATINDASFSADPKRGNPLTATITGNSEATRTLFVLRQDSGSACAPKAQADWSSYGGPGTFLSSSAGDAVSGDFSKSYTFTPSAATTYRICAYVAKTSGDDPLASHATAVTVRLPNASVAISGLPATFLPNTTATVSISGMVEDAASYAIDTVADGAPCSADDVDPTQPTTISPGPFSSFGTIDFGTEDSDAVCAYVFDGATGSLLATARATASKIPLEAPASLAASVPGRARKPSFVWKLGATGHDALILINEGQPVIRITTRGVAYFNSKGTKTGSSDPSLGKIEIGSDGLAHVHMKAKIPPGDYKWMVERTRAAGEQVDTDTQELHVPGPRLKTLHATTSGYPGHSSKYPGHTLLRIRTTPYATVKVEFSRSGRKQTYWYSWNYRPSDVIRFDWTCKVKGASAYRYVVTARDDSGHEFKRQGAFGVASNTQCDAWRAAEAAARARKRAAERARALAQARREAAAYAEYVRRWKVNCEGQGGTPVLTYSYGDSVWRCRGPYGFYIPVPEP